MLTAFILGSVGLVSALLLGSQVLGMSVQAVLHCVLSANVAGMVALMLVLKGERVPWVRNHVFYRPLWTWSVFVTLFFGTLLGTAPPLRDWKRFAWLIVPLILSTGFWIILFGPIQDRVVERIQRRSRT